MVQKSLSTVVTILLLALLECSYVSSKSLEGLASREVQPEYSVQHVGRWNGDMKSQPMLNDLPEGGWENPPDPNMYVLRENYEMTQPLSAPANNLRRKRRGPTKGGKAPSLSIVNPLDVLRERLLLEIARRRIQQSTSQIQHNEQLLRKIGKRSTQEMEAATYEERMPSEFHS